MRTLAERLAQRAQDQARIAAPARTHRPEQPTSRVLHYMDRTGEARCDARTPCPHHIEANEPTCPACDRWFAGLRRGGRSP